MSLLKQQVIGVTKKRSVDFFIPELFPKWFEDLAAFFDAHAARTI